MDILPLLLSYLEFRDNTTNLLFIYMLRIVSQILVGCKIGFSVLDFGGTYLRLTSRLNLQGAHVT